MVLSKCTDCNHRDICRYKDDYEKAVGDITVKVPEPFTLMLSCKHYYSTTAYLTGSYDSTSYSNCSAHSAAQLSSHYK